MLTTRAFGVAKDWGKAATLMAKQLNMDGKYRDSSLEQADAIIYAYDYKSKDGTRKPDGIPDHFVSDLGNNKMIGYSIGFSCTICTFIIIGVYYCICSF